MDKGYTYIADLNKELSEIPKDGIVSRTLHNDDHLKAILFAFDQGQELSEHTASMPASIQIIKGEARITLGDDSVNASVGAWIHMSPGLRHSIYAETTLVMLLLLIKSK
jgi:quercetin dioxygenase-like cupin family protein